MSHIEVITDIDAPIERCFALALNVDLHQASTARTKERVIAGVMTGMMKENETVTWRARHFGVMQNLTSRVYSIRPPYYFIDEMLRGTFKSLRHEHIFEHTDGSTLMIDKLDFEAPFGILGRLFCSLVLERYMHTFISKRNAYVKQVAESEEWRKYL